MRMFWFDVTVHRESRLMITLAVVLLRFEVFRVKSVDPFSNEYSFRDPRVGVFLGCSRWTWPKPQTFAAVKTTRYNVHCELSRVEQFLFVLHQGWLCLDG